MGPLLLACLLAGTLVAADPTPENTVCLDGQPLPAQPVLVSVTVDGVVHWYGVRDQTMARYVRAMDPKEAVRAFAIAQERARRAP